MPMRDWHRWIMTVFGVVLAYWVIAGLTTAIYDANDRTQVWALQGGGPGQRLTDFAISAAAVPDPATLAPGIATAIAAAEIAKSVKRWPGPPPCNAHTCVRSFAS